MPPKEPSAAVIPLSQWHRPVTYGDLQMMKRALREEIVQDLRGVIGDQRPKPQKQWLNNKSVRDLLGVSPGTLQSMRDNGILPFSRIGRYFYYDPAEIEAVIERRKSMGRQRHF